jgi:hypothetical protein
MRSRPMPAAAKYSGKMPHAMPSFKLLTSPAWLTLDRLRSLNVVRQNTSRCDTCASACFAERSAVSCATWSRVSCTSNAEISSPQAP